VQQSCYDQWNHFTATLISCCSVVRGWVEVKPFKVVVDWDSIYI